MLTGALSQMQEWSEAEDTALRGLYPLGSWELLLAALENRTKGAINKRAFKLGVKRRVKEDPPGYREKLSQRCKEKPPRLGKVLYPVIEREGAKGKFCAGGCGWRPLEKFARHPECSGGVRNICTTCEGRQAYAGNRAARIASVRRYQVAHPEAHRERKNTAQRRRHGKMMEGPGVSVADVRELRAQYGGLCAYCCVAVADTLDHVTPLSRGGLHSIENLLPACKACNFEKHDKTLAEWQAFRSQRRP